MSREFRLTVTIPLASDEFEQAAGVIACGKLKASVVKAMEEHKLSGVVGHEIVTPRASTAKIVPGAPSTSEARATAAEARQTQPLHPRSAA